QVLDAHGLVHRLDDGFPVEHFRQPQVGGLDQAGGGGRGQVGQLAGLLHIAVAVVIQGLGQFAGVVEDVVKAQLVQFRQLGGVAQGQAVEVLVGVRGEKGQVAAATAHLHQVVGDQFAADHHGGDGLDGGIGLIHGLGLGSDVKVVEEVHRLGVDIGGGGAGDLVVAALEFAVALDQRQHIGAGPAARSEEHTSELQSRENLVCRLLLEK